MTEAGLSREMRPVDIRGEPPIVVAEAMDEVRG